MNLCVWKQRCVKVQLNTQLWLDRKNFMLYYTCNSILSNDNAVCQITTFNSRKRRPGRNTGVTIEGRTPTRATGTTATMTRQRQREGERGLNTQAAGETSESDQQTRQMSVCSDTVFIDWLCCWNIHTIYSPHLRFRD